MIDITTEIEYLTQTQRTPLLDGWMDGWMRGRFGLFLEEWQQRTYFSHY